MSDLLYEVIDHVGVMTLNRPEAMNSLSYQLYADIEDTVRSSEARVLVITGNGRAFCAGDDMKQILGSGEPAPKEFRDRAKATGGLTPAADALLHTDIPVIAAVNGPAVGWGMELALMADIVLPLSGPSSASCLWFVGCVAMRRALGGWRTWWVVSARRKCCLLGM
jgi:enoyl-CoA hydratase